MWRHVEKTESSLLVQAHEFEQGFPAFYQAASHSWTATKDEVLAFYDSCSQLYGIFDKTEFVALIYFRPITPTHQEVHLDAKRGIRKELLQAAIEGVRDDRLQDAMSVETWVLRQNRALQGMLAAARFTTTGLEMKAGKSHGKVLRWVQMLVRRGNNGQASSKNSTNSAEFSKSAVSGLADEPVRVH